MKKIVIISLLFVLLSSFGVNLSDVRAESRGNKLGGMHYIWWDFNQNYFKEIAVKFTIYNDPLTKDGLYLQMYQGKINGVGFYFGLQTRVGKPTAGFTGKGLIFSRWNTKDLSNAKPAQGGWTESAGYEGDFISIRKSYKWTNHKYSIRICFVKSDNKGDWYGVWINDLNTLTEDYLGSLRFPKITADKRGIQTGGGTWTEIYYKEADDSPLPDWHVSINNIIGIDFDNRIFNPRGATLICSDKFQNINISFEKKNQKIHFYMGKDIRRNTTTENIELGKGTYIIIVGKTELMNIINPFVDFKKSQGFTVETETTKDIEKKYSGIDLAEKIRNYLKDRVADICPTYTLLIGAPYTNKSNETSISTGGDIPMRYVYPDYDKFNNFMTIHYPTDFYYCDLKGNWDKNGDNHYGDTFDDEIIEVTNNYVGRIPFSNSVTVKKILDNTINIESKIKKENLNHSVLLAMFQSGGNRDPRSDTALWGEEVKKEILKPNGFSTITLYEKEGDSPSVYGCTAPLNANNFRKYFPNNDIVVTDGHGGITRTIWNDKNKNGKVDEGEFSYPTFFPVNTLQNLSKSGYSTKIFYDWGCHTFDVYGNYSSAVTANSILSSGIAGTVVATTSSVGFPLDLHQFFETVVKNKKTAGEYLYDPAVPKNKWGKHRNYITNTCILGDPSLGLFTFISKTPFAPKNLTTTADNTNKSIILKWSPSLSEETYPISGYAIYRGTKPNSSSAAQIAITSSSITTYTDRNVTLGKTYFYYVKAFDNQTPPNYSEPSNEVSIEIKDTTPPTITINSPEDGAETSDDFVNVSGTITDDLSGIDSATINGNSLTLNSDGSFSTTVSLTEGDNTITITATDKAGNKATKTITVVYKPKTVITLQPDNPYMTVNGVQQEIDPGRGTKPVIIPKWGRTVVPIRAIVEALGGTIEWDGTERKVTINFNGTVIELWIDKPQARVNGEMKWIDPNNHDVKPIIINSRTMLPLRFVAESLGCTVQWDAATRTITITYTP